MRERRVKPNAALYVGYADDDEDIGKALTTPLLLIPLQTSFKTYSLHPTTRES